MIRQRYLHAPHFMRAIHQIRDDAGAQEVVTDGCLDVGLMVRVSLSIDRDVHARLEGRRIHIAIECPDRSVAVRHIRREGMSCLAGWTPMRVAAWHSVKFAHGVNP